MWKRQADFCRRKQGLSSKQTVRNEIESDGDYVLGFADQSMFSSGEHKTSS